ncbi:hypothetical protein L3X38_034979 [Prunus dulcis]|uniref:Uncharacterized protein n=1 Tax=Prunus dulcis TaxID=3755 RepID=A0AAD4VIT9_PRUDU|nr:hypothetical protein L3X38_034979 [Prunus dulcis]
MILYVQLYRNQLQHMLELEVTGVDDVATSGSRQRSESVLEDVFVANSMVQVRKDVLCLGFVDARLCPSNPRCCHCDQSPSIGGQSSSI